MSPDTTAVSTTIATNRTLRIALWVAQVLLFLVFSGAGLVKLNAPIPEPSAMMRSTGQYSPASVRFIGMIDLTGVLGILMPTLSRMKPGLGLLAALGCAVLQVLAIGFHASRSEFIVLPLNFILLVLSLFVLWGRSKPAPIAARA